jgi:MFS transporter, PPP family, 3-phenylpropionic acid transporter
MRLYYLAAYTSMGVYLPFISPWLVAYGISGFRLSLVSATRPIAGILAPLLFGWLADRFRMRGSLLQWACVASAIPFSVILVAGLLGREVGFLSAFVAVACFSLFRIPMLTIADVTALESPQRFGALRLWGSMGFMLAALGVGFWLPEGRSLVFPLMMSLSLVAALAFARKLPQRAVALAPDLKASFQDYVGRTEHLVMFGVWILWAMSHVAYDMCISLHVRDLGGSFMDVSLAWGIGTLAEVILMGLCGALLPKATHATWTFLGLLVTTSRWLLLAHVQSRTMLLLLQPLHAVSFALLWMTWLDYVKQNAPAHVLGRAQGFLATAVSIGGAAGMFIWGPLYASQGSKQVFQGAAIIAAAASLLSLVPLLGGDLQWFGSKQASSSS